MNEGDPVGLGIDDVGVVMQHLGFSHQ
jgi:hypothetical protein